MDKEKPRRIDLPEPGMFQMRLVRGGPFVPARIEHDENGWLATINGEKQFPATPEPNDAVDRVWTSGRRIIQSEYKYLLARVEYARANKGKDPLEKPRQKINILAYAPPDFTS